MSEEDINVLGAEKGTSNVPNTIRSNFLTKFIEDDNVGKLIHFRYDPKYKNRLYQYDVAPLVVMLSSYPDGFGGLNLHFAPNIKAAEVILREISHNVSNNRNDMSTRMVMTYELFKTLKAFDMGKECFRRYLFSHLRSGVMVIDPDHWIQSLYYIYPEFKKGLKKS